jgi:hypothetical protein
MSQEQQETDELFEDEMFECDHDLQRIIFKWSNCLNGKLNYLEIQNEVEVNDFEISYVSSQPL